MTERMAYTIPETAELLGTSYKAVYRLIKTGEIRARMAGKRYLIPREEIQRWVDGATVERHLTTVPEARVG